MLSDAALAALGDLKFDPCEPWVGPDHPDKEPARSLQTPLAAALGYLKRGWCPIPIPPGKKGPRAAGWDKLRIDVAAIPRHFNGTGNVGVILGPPSGDLVDVDLDCAEALELADLYLPQTGAEFGRQSRPRSHRLYVAPGARFEVFADPVAEKKTTLVELRAEGNGGGAHQTLMPPSVADGERREWHGETIEPVAVDARALARRCAYLSIACLIRRYVSATASERQAPDMPDLLWELDHDLGRRAYEWLGRPAPDQPRRYPKARHEMTRAEVDLAEVVHAIPNNADWHAWNAIGMAIFAVDPSEHGEVVFDDWSAKSSRYDPNAVKERWNNYRRSPPTSTGIGKLAALAYRNGWRPERS